jgi:murein DD-endopeptidase MepM/ murein hydrolase activator NlpD
MAHTQRLLWSRSVAALSAWVMLMAGAASAQQVVRDPMTSVRRLPRGYEWPLTLATGGTIYHTGLDLEPGTGSSDRRVLAVADGIVVRIHRQAACAGVNCTQQCPSTDSCTFGPGGPCPDHGMGNVVFLAHVLADGTQIFSASNHLASTNTSLVVGQCVTQGTVLGEYGGSGNGCVNHWYPHLHFEFKRQPTLGNACRYGSKDVNTAFGYVPSLPASAYGFVHPDTVIGKQQAQSCAQLLARPCRTDGAPDTLAAARLIQSNDPLYGECINHPNDEDWFIFWGERGQQVSLRAEPAPGSTCGLVQLAVKLRDGETNALPNVASGEATSVNGTLTQSGRFWVKIRRLDAALGPYTFHKTGVAGDIGDRTGPADARLGVEVGGFIEKAQDEDWFRIPIAAGQRVDAKIWSKNRETHSDPTTPLKMQAGLYASLDPNAAPVVDLRAQNEDLSTSDIQFVSHALAAGTYYLKIRGRGDNVGYYRMLINATMVPTP